MHHNNYPRAVLLARIILIHLKCLSTFTHGTWVIIHRSLFPFVLLYNTKKTFSCKWCKVLKQPSNNNTVDPIKRLFGTGLGGGSFTFVFEKCCHSSNINYTVGNVFSQHQSSLISILHQHLDLPPAYSCSD